MNTYGRTMLHLVVIPVALYHLIRYIIVCIGEGYEPN